VPGRVKTLFGLAVVVGLMVVGRADAYIYWVDDTGEGDHTIARAENDGSGVNRTFIGGLGEPCGVAVDAQHIYWADRELNAIGRAHIDGTGVERTFIPLGPSFGAPCGPSLGAGKVWWASLTTLGPGAIGRANLDGTAPQPGYFTGASAVGYDPIATTLGGGFVYWSVFDLNGPGPLEPSIGRAGPDGTPAPDGDHLSLAGGQLVPTWIAADATHYYVAAVSFSGAGLGVIQSNHAGTMIDNPTAFSASGGLALHEGKLYIANGQEGTISRMNPDGTDVEPTIVTRAGKPAGLAVDGLSTPPGALTVGKLERNKKKGTGALSVTVNGPGTVGLEGNGLKPASAQAAGAGDVVLSVKATGSKRKALKRKGKVKLTAELGFVPTAGTPAGETVKLKLVRK
jgi:hypothetical protein